MGWGYSPLFHMTSKVALRLIPTGWPQPLSSPPSWAISRFGV